MRKHDPLEVINAKYAAEFENELAKLTGATPRPAPKRASRRKPKRAASTAGTMTVAEAGRKGGLVVRATRGHDHFVAIGRKGGHKVRDLIAAGKKALAATKP